MKDVFIVKNMLRIRIRCIHKTKHIFVFFSNADFYIFSIYETNIDIYIYIQIAYDSTKCVGLARWAKMAYLFNCNGRNVQPNPPGVHMQVNSRERINSFSTVHLQSEQ